MEGIKKRPRKKRDRRYNRLSAAEAAQLTEDLPNRAAIRSAVVIAIEKEHLADLLVSICLARTGIIVIVL